MGDGRVADNNSITGALENFGEFGRAISLHVNVMARAVLIREVIDVATRDEISRAIQVGKHPAGNVVVFERGICAALLPDGLPEKQPDVRLRVQGGQSGMYIRRRSPLRVGLEFLWGNSWTWSVK